MNCWMIWHIEECAEMYCKSDVCVREETVCVLLCQQHVYSDTVVI